MALPHTTESVQWGANLVFKIGGKIYAMAELEATDHWLSFKCSPEDFAELCEREGIIPAPYLARAQWLTLETEDTITRPELKRLLRQAYDLVFATLPKKTQAALK
ncbi:MAG: MmcQ/YjbR family DNA-binding protein [Candidatus Solibacter sp.]|nr:MmcQ/YjbR family DNA-binding protein [Candidatus Solibacter sp.]